MIVFSAVCHFRWLSSGAFVLCCHHRKRRPTARPSSSSLCSSWFALILCRDHRFQFYRYFYVWMCLSPRRPETGTTEFSSVEVLCVCGCPVSESVLGDGEIRGVWMLSTRIVCFGFCKEVVAERHENDKKFIVKQGKRFIRRRTGECETKWWTTEKCNTLTRPKSRNAIASGARFFPQTCRDAFPRRQCRRRCCRRRHRIQMQSCFVWKQFNFQNGIVSSVVAASSLGTRSVELNGCATPLK